MKHLLLAGAVALVLAACQSKKPLLTNDVQTEFEQLDTLYVTAPQGKIPQEFDQDAPTEPAVYNPSHKRDHDLLHTSLELKFDWENEKVLGRAVLTLTPYFYPSNQLVLDAKGFEWKAVHLETPHVPLTYDYDGEQITLQLDRTYRKGEHYTLVLDYIASPSAEGGSAAITSDKGLFFINPRGEEGDKPRQIWTQGETENNSRWFPTIDKPNERCTQEIRITIPETYASLSNGLLVSSEKNNDGTKTDYWRMDQPHAPYLFMLAIGAFAVVEESWRGKPITYYVEPEYKEDATYIFSNTVEMLEFFSEKLHLTYPWPKYAQVVVRDYVSGAMENTTSVIFGEFVQQHRRDLIDNHNEKIVAHEMFHHWFGDLVTCESWANLTLNEGFANYSEYLWLEHKYGRDEADYHLLSEWGGYFYSARSDMHPLIHFGYEDKENMFDAHSYNKGGAILHMLRNYVGDDAFWAALNLYLSEHAYGAVEAHDLRLAFEKITGEDLNWFFNQWFFDQGHPQIMVAYDYDEASQKAMITVDQQQEGDMPAAFQLPAKVRLYFEDGTVQEEKVWIKDRKQVLNFEASKRPALMQFDADRMLLAQTEDNKTEEQYLFQFQHAPRLLDRLEAMDALGESENQEQVMPLMKQALKDPFWYIRGQALSYLSAQETTDEATRSQIRSMALGDPHSAVRTAALQTLSVIEDEQVIALAKQMMNSDSAYAVIGEALQIVYEKDNTEGLQYAKKLEKEESTAIRGAIAALYAESGDIQYLPFFETYYPEMDGYDAISFFDAYQSLLLEGSDEQIQKGIDLLKTIGLSSSESPWRKFGATRSLSILGVYFNSKFDESRDASEKEKLDKRIQYIIQSVEEIKTKEPNEQLREFYDQGLPPIRP
ncbi:MAG TPA: M1 family metallopeptidase [Saprospiraceae bacterium]|nr:M1 family metallopeptidase [Saprospiraceae bacterium]HMQ82235.1 M1 family metallopeptidase [Saprospiraceae bacterium]